MYIVCYAVFLLKMLTNKVVPVVINGATVNKTVK